MTKVKYIDDIIAVKWIAHVASYIRETEKLGLPDDIEENREQLKKMLTQHIESMLADVPINEDTNRKEMKLNKSMHLTWNRHGIISIEYSKEPYIYDMHLFGSPIEDEACEVASPETSEERIAVLTAENTTVYANRIADKLVERTSVFSPHSYQAASRYMQHFYTGKKTSMPHKLQTTIDNMKLFLKQIETLPSRYSRFDEFLSDFKAALIRPKDVEITAEAILSKMRETLNRYKDLDDEHLEHYKNNNDGIYDAVKSQSLEPFIKRAMEPEATGAYVIITGGTPQGCFDYESIMYSCANKYPELIRIEKDERAYYNQYSARLPLSDMYREFIKLRSKYFAVLHAYAFVDDFEMPFGSMWRKTWQTFEKGYYSPTDKNNYPRYISEDVVLRAPVMTMQTMARIDERIRTAHADEPVIGDNDSCSIIVKDITDCGAPVCSAKDAYEDAAEAGITQWLALEGYAEILDFTMESLFEDTAVNRAGIKPDDVDEVLMGCVLQAAQGQSVARQAAVYAGIPVEKPALTLNNLCGSGMKCINLGADMITAGDADVGRDLLQFGRPTYDHAFARNVFGRRQGILLGLRRRAGRDRLARLLLQRLGGLQ